MVDEQCRPSGPTALHILVIDDEDYIADMLASVLRTEGYQVEVAYNAREGLKLAQATRPALLVIDVMMPCVSGMTMIEHLREEESMRTIPIIVTSAGTRPTTMIAGVTFIAKPFDIDEIIELVASHIGHVAESN